MGKKEEITDLISDEGIRNLKKGQVLKFNYEGSITAIRITRVDRKAMRIWGEHINLAEPGKGFSHYGHNLDVTPETVNAYGYPYCEDCEMPVNEQGTLEGDNIAQERAKKKEAEK